jgi:hypothetical protein
LAITTASGTSRDKANKSYVDSPNRENFTAQEVIVGNTSDNPIPVSFSSRGTAKVDFNEVSSAGIESIEIINKTVAANVGIEIKQALCSGDNIAFFLVEINGEVKFKKRSYYTDFNADIDTGSIVLSEGDNIKIIVENKTNTSASFNATLIFNEFAA